MRLSHTHPFRSVTCIAQSIGTLGMSTSSRACVGIAIYCNPDPLVVADASFAYLTCGQSHATTSHAQISDPLAPAGHCHPFVPIVIALFATAAEHALLRCSAIHSLYSPLFPRLAPSPLFCIRARCVPIPSESRAPFDIHHAPPVHAGCFRLRRVARSLHYG